MTRTTIATIALALATPATAATLDFETRLAALDAVMWRG